VQKERGTELAYAISTHFLTLQCKASDSDEPNKIRSPSDVIYTSYDATATESTVISVSLPKEEKTEHYAPAAAFSV
jgi:hypothetical protein